MTTRKSLAEEAGIDTTVCELCEEPLDDKKPWKRGLDGCGAHISCLKRIGIHVRSGHELS